MKTRTNLTVKEAKELLNKNPVVIPDAFSHIGKELVGFKLVAQQLHESLRKPFEGIGNALSEFQKTFKTYTEQLPPTLSILADHGWYVCGNSGIFDSITLSIEIKKGKSADVDKFMVDFYEREFKHLINSLKESYPNRSKIISEAQQAHNTEMYYASTLLFLSTADGIFNGYLFKDSAKGKRNLKKELKKTSHLKEYGELLTKMSAIDAVLDKTSLFNSSLNRHSVMHGNDVEYGTRVNSLKALSLLAFICDFFDKVEN